MKLKAIRGIVSIIFTEYLEADTKLPPFPDDMFKGFFYWKMHDFA